MLPFEVSKNFSSWLMDLEKLVKFHQYGLIGVVDYFTECDYDISHHKYVFAITDRIPITNNELFKVKILGYDASNDKPFDVFLSNCRTSKQNLFYATFSEVEKDPNTFIVESQEVVRNNHLVTIRMPFKLRNFEDFKDFIACTFTSDFVVDRYCYSLGMIAK